MPLVRSKSQSSPIQSTTLLLQHWRRRRTSNTTPSSPLATPPVTFNNTDSFPTSDASSRSSSSGHSMQLNQDSTTINDNQQVYRSASPTNPLTVLPPPLLMGTTSASSAIRGLESNNTTTTRIRLLPNIELMSRSFVFDIIDCSLTPTTALKIGRYSERHSSATDRLSFKSKVVSRAHAELWVTSEKKVYIRDIGSSSGTFINRVRLSKSHETSQPLELKNGDIIQLGIDYQGGGGMDQKYLAVKIRLEINSKPSNDTFCRHVFQQCRQYLLGGGTTSLSNKINIGSGQLEESDTTIGVPEQQQLDDRPEQEMIANQNNDNTPSIQECCICLYAIAPLQALFIAPCSHIYHFKCLRPILQQHYPGFSCPLCRNYYDLEASMALEDTAHSSPMTTTTALATMDQDGVFGNVLSFL